MNEAENGSLDPLVTAAELAEDFAISDVELGRLARNGILPRVPDPEARRSWLYPLRRCFRAYIRHLKSAEIAAREALIEAKVKQTDLKTRREELRLEIERGAYIRKDQFFEAFEPLFLSYRQNVLSRPTRLERRLTRAKSREARIKILVEDAHEALSLFAEMLQNGAGAQNGTSPVKRTF